MNGFENVGSNFTEQKVSHADLGGMLDLQTPRTTIQLDGAGSASTLGGQLDIQTPGFRGTLEGRVTRQDATDRASISLSSLASEGNLSGVAMMLSSASDRQVQEFQDELGKHGMTGSWSPGLDPRTGQINPRLIFKIVLMDDRTHSAFGQEMRTNRVVYLNTGNFSVNARQLESLSFMGRGVVEQNMEQVSASSARNQFRFLWNRT